MTIYNKDVEDVEIKTRNYQSEENIKVLKWRLYLLTREIENRNPTIFNIIRPEINKRYFTKGGK